MIVLKNVRKEVAKQFPETPSIIHEMDDKRYDIVIKDDALASVEYKKDLLLITFDLDYSINYNFDWIIGIHKEEFMYVELY